ncbi:hypothetical protein HON36_02025 [Candidatus Parcubacteria bacterium]|jgi:hypothetical protein|nr:hypothetical protein [Candidatus Parcubacteria bacterium]
MLILSLLPIVLALSTLVFTSYYLFKNKKKENSIVQGIFGKFFYYTFFIINLFHILSVVRLFIECGYGSRRMSLASTLRTAFPILKEINCDGNIGISIYYVLILIMSILFNVLVLMAKKYNSKAVFILGIILALAPVVLYLIFL